jgi:hypothetical protein
MSSTISNTNRSGQIKYLLTHATSGVTIEVTAVESGDKNFIPMTIVQKSAGVKTLNAAYFPFKPGAIDSQTALHRFAIDFDYDLELWTKDEYTLLHNSDYSTSLSL